jgi:toxin ParE1/3/4
MARVLRRPAARQDFIAHYVYLAEHAGVETAQRFRRAVEATFTALARMPGIGSPHKVEGRHAGVRLWRVRGFREYLIAYQLHAESIAIERLIHAKQDYQRVLR